MFSSYVFCLRLIIKPDFQLTILMLEVYRVSCAVCDPESHLAEALVSHWKSDKIVPAVLIMALVTPRNVNSNFQNHISVSWSWPL
jgi:hypothetical protein